MITLKNIIKIKQTVTVIAIPLFILSWSQGCSKMSFLDTNIFAQKSSDTQTEMDPGNGGTYDGKLRVLHHYENGFQCENRNAPESILITRNFDQGQWVLIQNSKEKCALVDQVPVTGVVYDDVKKEAQYNGKTYVAPKPYVVDTNEDPNLPDVKPLDAVCEDVNGKCSLLASLQTSEIASYTAGVDVSIPAATFKLSNELALTSGPNGNPISVHGAGSNTTILDGQGATDILRIFGSAGSGVVNLQGLTLQNGFLPYAAPYPPTAEKSWAAALENSLPAQLNLVDIIFANNTGADVFQTTQTGGAVSIQKSRFLNNSPDGWAIRFENIKTGPLLLDEVEISNTKIGRGGGAISVTFTPLGTIGVIVRNSLIRGTKGAALWFKSVDAALIENTTITDNDQQALSNLSADSTTAGDIKIVNSTLYNNGALTGWGPSNIYLSGGASPQTLNFQNTIVAEDDPSVVNCTLNNGATTTATNSLINDATCKQTGSGNISGNPLLAPFADNGGFTQTRLPLGGSPVIDAGNNAVCLPKDQRGSMRPVDRLGGGAKCDIGAVELQ